MRTISAILLVIVAVAVFALPGPGAVFAQSEGTISTTVLDSGTFVTVKETNQGDLIFLYKVRGERIVLVDAVINSRKQSGMSVDLPDRYLYRMDVENK